MTSSKNRSLRSLQISILKRMLQLNIQPEFDSNSIIDGNDEMDKLNQIQQEVSDSLTKPLADDDPIWKVLVFDKTGQKIIAPVLRVNDLLKSGITMHMLLESDRHSLQDVPAIYFIKPTKENIDRIANDLSKDLYESFYINFISPVPRSLLEDFAQKTINNSSLIQQVYDQYLNFIVTEPNLFSLGYDNIYSTLASPKVQDEVIEKTIDNLVNGLFSVTVTMNVPPIIRCTKGNAAEMIARKLDQKIRDAIVNTKSSNGKGPFPSTVNSLRPVLIIIDRNLDLVSMLSHSWTYQGLVQDTLDFNLNRITIPAESSSSNEKSSQTKLKPKATYDIDLNDFFWEENASIPFPQMAENLDKEIDRYKSDTDRISRQTGINNLSQIDDDLLTPNAHKLKDVMTTLPELTARKKTLDMHMNIATEILKSIKDRSLDNLFQMEETISRQNKATILEAIKAPHGSPEDKLRLFIIYFLSVDNISPAELEEFEKALAEQKCDLLPLKYVKRAHETAKMTMMSTNSSNNSSGYGSNSNSLGQSSNSTGGGTSEIFRGLGNFMKDSAFSGGFDNLISGVKNLLPSKKDLALTQIVDSIADPSASSGSNNPTAAEEYLHFDPKISRLSGSRQPSSQSFLDCVVFTVGGGSYLEYGNLQEWGARKNPKRRVFYGSSGILNPHQFMNELHILGETI